MDLEAFNEAIRLVFPEREALAVMSELSALEGDEELRGKDKEYRGMGRFIMRSAYSVYLYLEDGARNTDNVGSRSQAICQYLNTAIYDSYNLDRFVVKGPTATNGKTRVVVVEKLVASIYRTFGFLSAYNFMKPFFLRVPKKSTRQFKTVLQEYVQARRLSCEYKIVNIAGPQHAPVFTCELHVGNQIVRADGSSKKSAETEAAKIFVERRGIRSKRELKQAVVRRSHKTEIDGRRKGDLNSVISMMRLPRACISMQMLDEALTHPSYAGEHDGIVPNETLHLVGGYACEILSYDYIDGITFSDRKERDAKRAFFTSEDHLASAIPNELLRYLKTGNAYKCATNLKLGRIKVDVAKSILGCLWLEYCATGDEATATIAREYAYRLFDSGKTDESAYFRTAMQSIVQRYHLVYSEDYEELPYGSRHKPVYGAKVIVTDNSWAARGYGTGDTKKSARNRALRTIITSVAKKYPDDETVLTLFGSMQPELCAIVDTPDETLESTEAVRPSDVNGEPLASKLSENTGNEFSAKPSPPSNDTQKEGHTDAHSMDTGQESLCERDSEKPKEPELRYKKFEELSFAVGSGRTLYIGKGTRTCRNRGHNIVCVTGLFRSYDGRLVRVNVFYCNDCDIFFLDYQNYLFYRNRYGALLGNYIFEGSGYSEGSGFDSYAKQSILMMCGYTVSQAQGLTASQRRAILGNMMDSGKCDKATIMSYLQFFIAQRSSIWNMQLACSKWQEDLNWVRNYRISQQDHLVFSGTSRYR